MNARRIGFLCLAAVTALGACDREEILPGERFGTRVPLSETLPADTVTDAQGNQTVTASPQISAPVSDAVFDGADAVDVSVPITLAQAQNLESWPQRAYDASNRIVHATLSQAPQEIWSASIGRGNSRRYRITADPVAGDGRIFAMDSRAGLSAVGTDGTVLWSQDLTPGFDRGVSVSGGGLALGNGHLYASTGYGELIALDPASGEILWRQRLDAGAGVPTVTRDSVYVVSRDDQAWSIDPETGRVRWQVVGTPAAALLEGGAAPTVTDRLVIFPFGTGELSAVLRLSGLRVWGTTLAGTRPGVAYNSVNDISGDPVVAGNRVFAGNQSGRVVAMDAGSGTRLWTAQDGSYSPLLVAGGSIFFVSDRNELLRISAETGERIWGVELPLYVQRRERRRQAVFAHYGPILAGGQLVIASSDGEIRFISPESGDILSTIRLRSGAAAQPIIMDGVLYVVDGNGRLHAYR